MLICNAFLWDKNDVCTVTRCAYLWLIVNPNRLEKKQHIAVIYVADSEKSQNKLWVKDRNHTNEPSLSRTSRQRATICVKIWLITFRFNFSASLFSLIYDDDSFHHTYFTWVYLVILSYPHKKVWIDIDEFEDPWP